MNNGSKTKSEKNDNETMEYIHKFSSRNRSLLLESINCGCFYCEKIFDSNLITEWIDDNETALCPYCEIDSVIPDNLETDLNRRLLNSLNKYWFK